MYGNMMLLTEYRLIVITMIIYQRDGIMESKLMEMVGGTHRTMRINLNKLERNGLLKQHRRDDEDAVRLTLTFNGKRVAQSLLDISNTLDIIQRINYPAGKRMKRR